MVAKPARQHEVLDICRKWDLEAAVIVPRHGHEAIRLSCDRGLRSARRPADRSAPDADRRHSRAGADRRRTGLSPPREGALAVVPIHVGDPGGELSASPDPRASPFPPIGSPNIGSRASIWRQYDQYRAGGNGAAPRRVGRCRDPRVLRGRCATVREVSRALGRLQRPPRADRPRGGAAAPSPSARGTSSAPAQSPSG